ncbi:hypothetical protein cypCar_00040424 [Cyprinus carpio]|nr:hypothetical protein cypCar_00040424 [Cyprinus carpio]
MRPIRKLLLGGHKFKALVYQAGLILRKPLLVSQHSSYLTVVRSSIHPKLHIR